MAGLRQGLGYRRRTRQLAPRTHVRPACHGQRSWRRRCGTWGLENPQPVDPGPIPTQACRLGRARQQ